MKYFGEKMFGRNKNKKLKKKPKPISFKQASALSFIISVGGEVFHVPIKGTKGFAEAIADGNIIQVKEFMVRYRITHQGHIALAEYSKRKQNQKTTD